MRLIRCTARKCSNKAYKDNISFSSLFQHITRKTRNGPGKDKYGTQQENIALSHTKMKRHEFVILIGSAVHREKNLE